MVQCKSCRKFFSVLKHDCFCGVENSITHIVAKARPILLWHSQTHWLNSVAFAIPLSSSDLLTENRGNEIINKTDYKFSHTDPSYYIPRRAMISQATRIEANTLNRRNLIGKLVDETSKGKIENKLLNWIFDK